MTTAKAIRVFSALAIRAPFVELENAWLEQHPDQPLVIDWNPTTVIEKKIAAGEQADAVILTVPVMDRLIAEGLIVPSSRVELVDSKVGLAILPEGKAPDISNVEALKTALLEAKSVAYSLGGASGIYFQTLLKKLGIEQEVNARATTIPEGFTATQLIAGKADIAVQQISELLMVQGIKVLGPLPEEVQKVTSFSGGIFSHAVNPQGAAALLATLRSPTARKAFEAFGLECRN
ncbi:ABC transporter substrate-binding protein [Erwinia endophytica]|uniref:molybdate ABC transporter substrate-binding protein n=1 Tax=Erwinia endophytica TaxID=1563158 RepID=UPI001265F15F|nr:substrate-binding domain-containing protein [Erwinia endophytica]KAB8313733.1 ABC transporter substrate-binding protein [Erwinia endophytica]